MLWGEGGFDAQQDTFREYAKNSFNSSTKIQRQNMFLTKNIQKNSMIKMQNIYLHILPKTRIDKNVIKLVSGTVCTASIIKDNLNSTVLALLLYNNGFIIT